jgi:hypothetical protein
MAERRTIPQLFQANCGRALRGELASCRASVFCTLVPAPFLEASPVLTVLTWRQKVSLYQLTSRKVERRVIGVYQATLRLLQRWILAHCQHSPREDYLRECLMEPKPLNYGDIDCRGVPREECAYKLLRYAIERDYRDCSVHADVRTAMPWGFFRITEPSLQSLPRLPLRAIFLAMYAEGYLRLNGRDSFSLALEGVRSDAELLMFAGEARTCRWGFVAFPPVPGMPTTPFHRRGY